VEKTVARNEDENSLVCTRCDAPLVKSDTKFDYLGHIFTHNAQKCPVCGMVYVSEELAAGRIAEIETLLEDK